MVAKYFTIIFLITVIILPATTRAQDIGIEQINELLKEKLMEVIALLQQQVILLQARILTLQNQTGQNAININPDAPVIEYFKWTSSINPTQLQLLAAFKYEKENADKNFSIYLKYPNQETFTKYTYPIPQSNLKKTSGRDNTRLDVLSLNRWQWSTEIKTPSAFPDGIYKIHITVDNSINEEQLSSLEITSTLHSALIIEKPKNGETISSLPLLSTLNNTLSGLYYRGFIYKDTTQNWVSNFTNTPAIIVENPELKFTKGETYQFYVESYDNPYGNFSSIKQKPAQTSFIYTGN